MLSALRLGFSRWPVSVRRVSLHGKQVQNEQPPLQSSSEINILTTHGAVWLLKAFGGRGGTEFSRRLAGSCVCHVSPRSFALRVTRFHFSAELRSWCFPTLSEIPGKVISLSGCSC